MQAPPVIAILAASKRRVVIQFRKFPSQRVDAQVVVIAAFADPLASNRLFALS